MSPELQKLLAPARLGPLELRNRVIKTATFEGMTPQGAPTQQLIDFHTRMIDGGVALTTVGQCNVSPDARNLDNEMYLHPGIKSELRALTDAVHAHGGKISAQLTHCGYFKLNKPLETKRTIAPSFIFNKLGAPYGRPFAYPMTQRDIDRTIDDYARSTVLAREAGFDAVEIMACHGYLLNQFLSANTNKRTDRYGGSLENRLRFPLEVIAKTRAAIGKEFPILVKMNLDDACRGGLTIDDAVLDRPGVRSGRCRRAGDDSGSQPRQHELHLPGRQPDPVHGRASQEPVHEAVTDVVRTPAVSADAVRGAVSAGHGPSAAQGGQVPDRLPRWRQQRERARDRDARGLRLRRDGARADLRSADDQPGPHRCELPERLYALQHLYGT